MHINNYAIIMLNPTDKNHMIQIVNHAIQMETFYDANIKKDHCNVGHAMILTMLHAFYCLRIIDHECYGKLFLQCNQNIL